ncbi:MAG: hypothetical protein RIS44_1362 [Pseudomonadota bacterium]|jgi:hypothetical protein
MRPIGLSMRLAATTALALSLSACVVAPYPRHAVVTEPGYGPVVGVAPPSPYSEAIPVAPYPGAVWVGGYWGWSGHRHQWVPGYWERPRPGYGWRPHAWVRIGGGWQLRGGGWTRY